MRIQLTKIKGLLLIKAKKFKDSRGFLREIFLEKLIKKKFKFFLISSSRKNVFRGLHFQLKKPQGKIVSVIKGKIYDVVVDLRKKSKTFGKSYSVILSNDNCNSLYIPPGFAHGFIGLDKENIVTYALTQYRSITSENSIDWLDKDLKIKWPTRNVIISKKDNNGLTFKEVKKKIK